MRNTENLTLNKKGILSLMNSINWRTAEKQKKWGKIKVTVNRNSYMNEIPV